MHLLQQQFEAMLISCMIWIRNKYCVIVEVLEWFYQVAWCFIPTVYDESSFFVACEERCSWARSQTMLPLLNQDFITFLRPFKYKGVLLVLQQPFMHCNFVTLGLQIYQQTIGVNFTMKNPFIR